MTQEAADMLSDGQRSALLSGLGFYKLSVRRRRQLTAFFTASLIAHVVGLLVFGGWIVMRSRPEKATVFETPPPRRTYEPRKLEHKVKVQNRQRSSSRPSMVPRLVSMRMADIALPDIRLDPKVIHTTFQPKFKPVSGMGMGVGLGTGYGTHGFGEGMQTYDFFGIRARGDKVAILVDVSISMVEDERGGVAGYMAVKNRLADVIEALPDSSLFNVIVFADAGSGVFKELMIANDPNRTQAKLFIRPFNTEGNWGLTHGNLSLDAVGLPAYGGTTRLDIALTAAYAMGANTILIISDGIPRVKKGWTNEQRTGFNEQRRQWFAQHESQLRDWDTQWAGDLGVVATEQVRVWIPPTPEVPAPKDTRPLKEGQGPPPQGRPAQPGHWAVQHNVIRRPGWAPRPAPPPLPDPGYWTLADFVQHLNMLYEHYYQKRGEQAPIIHSIGYRIDNDGHAFLQGLARHFKGQYRRVSQIR